MTRAAARLRLAALAGGVAALFTLVALTGTLSPVRVRDAIDPLGAFAPIGFVAVSAALTCALFPGPLLAAASGLLFGAALGTPVSIVSATLGATLAFSISRFVARDSVDALAGARLRRLQAWIERRGFVAVLYARIAPGVPYSLVNYVAGLTRVSLGAFAAATAIGVAPRAYAYTALGGSLDDLGSPQAIIALVLLVLMALLGLTLARRDVGGASVTAPGSAAATSSPADRWAGRR